MKRTIARSTTSRPNHRRGVAMLLVMIGLVVCTILTAGFLSSQGTSIGIVQNEYSAEKCRAIAQSGIDMCYWQINNTTGWREKMTPGNWLNNVAVGDGTVTVKAVDGAGNAAFSTDPTQAVILTSTGSYNGRSFALTGVIQPTGGGTVFAGGNFFGNTITLENTAQADSYNSLVAAYNALFPGTNNTLWSNLTTSNSITIRDSAKLYGAVVAGPNSVLGNVINLLSLLLGLGHPPASISSSSETRIAGTVVAPNMTGFTAQAAYSHTGGNISAPAPGNYPSFLYGFTSGTATMTFSTSGTWNVAGNFTLQSFAKLVVSPGVNVVIYVGGTSSINGTITLGTGSSLTLYAAGNTTLTSSAVVNNGGDTSKLTLLGVSNGGIDINSATFVGSIYAPGSAITLENNAKVYGALAGQSLVMENAALFHFDQALQTKRIDNITGGSAPPGIADYIETITNAAFTH